ncbi:hypothetical protein QEZ54_16790 [Catellatospora sp. KI3]|uniref:hypothetical protein n=1 Tax=Catellatospora sp. KI3 TaxID=3041620 RepID=UPI0024821A94|nr:hypothetical protein [Catellatospora sp. KI3]MDI1462632.1 hypothetical protein [Catellatospora sp. KI3]
MTPSPPLHADPRDAARTRTRHQAPRASAVLTLAGVLTLALLGTAACGGKKDDPQTGATASTEVSTAPSASTAPSTPASASPAPQPTSGGDKPPSFPTSAKDYGLATLAAFASGSKSRLDLYANQAAVAQFMGHGKPDSQWTNLACEAVGDGQTACDYRNAHGDDARLTMMNTQLGHPTATTDVFLNRTQYASAANQYVTDFMAAWQDGNKQRMTRYSNSAVAGAFLGKTPPTGTQVNAVQSGSKWTVEVTGLPLGSGNWTFTVDGGKLGGGNAITAGKAD